MASSSSITSRQLNKYRFWCATESVYKYVWDELPPTQCPTSEAHVIDLNSMVIVDQITESDTQITNISKTIADEILVTPRHTHLLLSGSVGKNSYRDVYTTIGVHASVSNIIGSGEYALYGTDPNDLARLETANQSFYEPHGTLHEITIACRAGQSFPSNDTRSVKVGMFDDTEGFYYRWTGSNLFACVLRDGIETAISRDVWNVDHLDGTGKSAFTWNPENGNVYTLRFSDVYGTVQYLIQGANRYQTQRPWLGHVYVPSSNILPMVKNVRCPITVQLENQTSSLPTRIYVADRGYHTYGGSSVNEHVQWRMHSDVRTQVAIQVSPYPMPLWNLRKKAGYEGVALGSMDILLSSSVSSSIQIYVHIGTTLIGASFSKPSQVASVDHTIVEMDTSAVNVTGGTLLWSGLVTACSQIKVPLEHILAKMDRGEILTISAKMTRASPAVHVLDVMTLRWQENW